MGKVRFLGKTPTARQIFSFHFRPRGKIKQVAGQFITLNLPHEAADDRGTRRFFTLSSSPTENELTITTKLSDQGSSFKKHLANLPIGSELEMGEPRGSFILPDDKSQPLVFVAGGIGVTPFRSIIKYLVDSQKTRPIQLLYAANTIEEVAFRDLFDGQPWLKVTYIIGQPESDWIGPSGQLDGRRIAELAGGISGKLVYLSGPEPMIESFKQQLLGQNHPDELIKTDFFPGYKTI